MHKNKRTMCFFMAMMWCAAIAFAEEYDRDTFYQVSRIDVLMAGGYDGVQNFYEVKKHGDFGLGTLDKLDGEMLALDGKWYQLRANGRAYLISDDMTTPFADVTFFDQDIQATVPRSMNFDQLKQYLDTFIIEKPSAMTIPQAPISNSAQQDVQAVFGK